MNAELKAPFPWFGGKSRIADIVWDALGPVDNYVEPFAGSMAVLLHRPDERWQSGAETVNDAVQIAILPSSQK
jgi:site-specific DNA-adenine methylase